MSRNTHIRSHRYIPKRAKTPKPKFDWYSLAPKSMYNGGKKLKINKKAIYFQGILIILPWLWYAWWFGICR
jgi:hypothetical protein